MTLLSQYPPVVRAAVNGCVGHAVRLLCSGRAWAATLRYVLWIALACIAAALIFVLLQCNEDLHLRYWLGDLPSLALACILASLCSLALKLAYAHYITEQRRNEALHKELYCRWQSIAPMADIGCRLSPGSLRGGLMAVALLAVVGAFLGWRAGESARQLAAVLATPGPGTPAPPAGLPDNRSHAASNSMGQIADWGRCGAGGISQRLENAHLELSKFHGACLGRAGGRGRLVTECDGFARHFPAPATDARYLAALEESMGCSGFCHFVQRPLFVKSRRGNRGDTGLRRPCAARLGEHLAKWAKRVEVVTWGTAPILAVVALGLACYDDL